MKNAMTEDKKINVFLLQYSEKVIGYTLKLRQVLFANLPGIIEQIDISAKMIAYCYGQKYTEMICTVIPSKKGLKLGFYKGTELPDPDNLLNGTGKISRYVEIESEKQIKSSALKNLIASALAAYKQRGTA
ncbi:MAG: DUF1801 domain-containing protein [Chitinophagaceae bacterium]